MKIAFDHQIFTWQSFGGISRYIARLAEQLDLMGQDVSVFAPYHINSYLSEMPSEIVKGRAFKKFPYKTGRIVEALNHYCSKGGIEKWKPDLIHETYYTPFQRGKNDPCCPRIVTVYDMIHELNHEEFPANDKTRKLKLRAVRQAELVICISENTKRDLIEIHGIPEEKLRVVYLGVDHFGSLEQSDSSISKPQKRPYLLYVGNRGGYKNFDGFMRAFSSSDRLKSDFDIITFGGPKLSRSENVLAKSLGLREGQISHQSGDDYTLAKLYKNAIAFVFPSLYEGFGIPPLEAMAQGCPVIASDQSSIPEVVGGAGEYFSPVRVDHICHAIERVVYDEERKDRLRALGYEQIKKFSWEKCASETLSVYRSLKRD